MFFKLFVRAYAHKRERCAKIFIGNRCFHKKSNNATPILSVPSLKQFFKRQGLNVVDGHACIIADCPMCDIRKKGPKVYVNKTTGFFVCDNCRCTGSWDVLEKFLPAQKSSETAAELMNVKANLQVEQNYSAKWLEMEIQCQKVWDLPTEAYRGLLGTFSLPDISQKDMQQLNCIYDSRLNQLYFPLMALNNHIVGYKSLVANEDVEKTEPISDVGGCIVFREKNTKTDGTAVLVGTMRDFLALVSHKSSNTIICLPYNLQYLPQRLLPFLESFKKLILWFGNDETSWHTARQFAEKLHEKRCYFVRPTDLQPRPKLAAEMGYNLKSILKSAQSIWHESITTFHHLREDVLSDLHNIDKVQGVKWKRYPSLNRILKGHRRGEFTVLTGPTGSGKTTFMSDYSLDLAMQGVNTLWGSFEIRNARLARTMLQQMVGLPLDENLENFSSYADAFEKLPIYFMTFHGQQSIKVVMEAVEHATYVHDIAHVIIDNVQFMMGTSDETKHMDRFWKQDSIISRFRNFATKYNCHVSAIIHPRKERDDEELTTSSIFGSAKASQEADNVLIIQDKRLSSIRGKKFLQVAKNRYSGDLGIMVLDFDKSSLSYAQKKKTKTEIAEEEKTSKKSSEGRSCKKPLENLDMS